MHEFNRKEPYYHIKAEGGFTNWGISGFKGNGSIYEKLHTECICEKSGDVNIQQTVVRNTSEHDIILNHASSMLVNGIGRFDDENYIIYIFRSGWQGEMQWHGYKCSQLGIYNASNHANTNSAKICFNGSQTTCEYYPMIFIKDIKRNLSWFFEVEPLSGWYIEVGIMGDSLYVEANSAFNCNDGWFKTLKAGEEYITGKGYFGVVNGDICDAIRVFNDYKRENWKTILEHPKVVFNDYMNCLWAKPSSEKLIPLIDAAERAGCEVFCIDDGWYESGKPGDSLGDWKPYDDRFAPMTFQDMINYISDKNMIPGVWLEMESCSDTSAIYKKLKHCLLRRNGIIVGGKKVFLDFRTVEVREYTMAMIDELYNMGIRYIKNDYNHNLQLGCDGAESLSEGYALHRKAFISFIDEIRDKYSDLIIENCASGGMRSDFSFIRSMDLSSVSDQEFYYNNPSILAGTLACIPPEYCGSWAYPFPLKFDEQTDKSKLYCGREEIVFNMINAMLGTLYLSGHIECCDDEGMGLIQEAVKLYKEYRIHIKESYPIYITEPINIGQSGVMALGLKMSDDTILAVWKINNNERTVTLNIDKNIGSNAELIYPKTIETDFCFENNVLDITMEEISCARLFRIN